MSTKQKVFKIEFDNLDYTVFFGEDSLTIDPNYQWITTCGIRNGNEVETYWGNTIDNPNDKFSAKRGRQWAFRRAFIRMMNERYNYHLVMDILPPNSIVKELFNKFRKNLKEAGAW